MTSQDLMTLVVGIISGVVAVVISEVVWHPIRRATKWRVTLREIARLARNVECPGYTPGRVQMRRGGRAEEFDTRTLAAQLLNYFSPHLALLIGTYGTGKTFFCKYLVQNLAKKSPSHDAHVPIYLSGDRFQSTDIGVEIAKQISEKTLGSFTAADVGKLLKNPKVLLIIDGLDQLPAVGSSSEIIRAVLDFVSTVYKFLDGKCKVLLAMREEYYETTPGLRDFIESEGRLVLRLLGFSNNQIHEYLKTCDTQDGDLRCKILDELLNNPDWEGLLRRPVIAARFAKIGMNELKTLNSGSATLARIYELSFLDLESAAHEAARRIAYCYYVEDAYSGSEFGTVFVELEKDRPGSVGKLYQKGILINSQGSVEFAHATFRDYFAAEQIVRQVAENHGAQTLDDRVIHYLVCEFVAGLLKDATFQQLFHLIDSLTDVTALNNILDIFAETESTRRRDQISKQVMQSYEACDLSGEPNEYKIFLASTAAVFGADGAIEYVINYLNAVGIKVFIGKYFVTKQNYLYYGHNQDRFLLEWTKMIEKKKYGRYRCLMCVVLSELHYQGARQSLAIVVNDQNEDAVVKEYAVRALELLDAALKTKVR